jgi:hypothetical protein
MPLGYDGVMLVRAPSGCSQRHRRDMDTIGICEYPRMSKGAAGCPRVTSGMAITGFTFGLGIWVG